MTVASHDRSFLDRSVDHVLAINRADITVQKGGFSTWFSTFKQQQETEQRENSRLRKEIGRLEQSVDQTKQWSGKAEKAKRHPTERKIDRGFVSHRAAKVAKRAKSVAVRSEKAASEKSKLLHNLETADSLMLPALQHPKEILLRLTDVAACYDDRRVSEPISFELHRGDRLFLTGVNGSGKSSLLHLAAGIHTSHEGDVWCASGLVLSVVPQDTSGLCGSLSQYAALQGVDLSQFLAIVRKLGMDRDTFDRDISALFEGQKKKILLARSLCEPAHVYLWDEPLNYIDLYARMQIEEMIQNAEATMLLVEHDKAFREAVGTSEVRVVPAIR